MYPDGLDEGGEHIASQAGVSREARAQASGVVALASATAFIRVEVRMSDDCGVHGSWKELEAGYLRRAAIATSLHIESERVLIPLHRVSGEGNVQVCRAGRSLPAGSVHLHAIDDSVGKPQESLLHRESEGMARRQGRHEVDGFRDEGFVELGCERQ